MNVPFTGPAQARYFPQPKVTFSAIPAGKIKSCTNEAGMYMKKKIENKVSGARCEMSGREIRLRSSKPGSPKAASRLPKNYVPSRNVYENKGTLEPNHHSQIAIRQCLGSWLLAPVLQEMKVHPEMLLKTRDGKEKDGRYPVPGTPSRQGACWRRPRRTVELRGGGEYTLDRRTLFDLVMRPIPRGNDEHESSASQGTTATGIDGHGAA
jgi:hypothetical protein